MKACRSNTIRLSRRGRAAAHRPLPPATLAFLQARSNAFCKSFTSSLI